MEYRNLTLIGTSHIARQSLEEIKTAFSQIKPGIVAVELDQRRLASLFSKEQIRVGIADIMRIGVKGYLFATIGGWLQRKLGNIVGVTPGSEMKLAVELAKKENAKIALIDQDIEITLRKFSQRLSWREKFRFLGDIFRSVFFKKKALRELGIKDPNIDLAKVPDKELVAKLIKQLEKRYPNVYDVLVKQRNKVMANNLHHIMQQYPEEKILAVVGAGHEEEMIEMVKRRAEGKVDVVKQDFSKKPL
jgi:pheromone shutdown-related protein TraB